MLNVVRWPECDVFAMSQKGANGSPSNLIHVTLQFANFILRRRCFINFLLGCYQQESFKCDALLIVNVKRNCKKKNTVEISWAPKKKGDAVQRLISHEQWKFQRWSLQEITIIIILQVIENCKWLCNVNLFKTRLWRFASLHVSI